MRDGAGLLRVVSAVLYLAFVKSFWGLAKSALLIINTYIYIYVYALDGDIFLRALYVYTVAEGYPFLVEFRTCRV